MPIHQISLLVLVISVAGCSTTQVSEQTAAAVPSERIYVPNFIGPASTPAHGSILFLRDAGFGGAGCTHDIYVDTVKVLGLRHGEQATIHVPTGRHFIRLVVSTPICPDITTSQETEIMSGVRQVYRILLPADGNLRLTRVE
jgi:hypothetical protein